MTADDVRRALLGRLKEEVKRDGIRRLLPGLLDEAFIQRGFTLTQAAAPVEALGEDSTWRFRGKISVPHPPHGMAADVDYVLRLEFTGHLRLLEVGWNGLPRPWQTTHPGKTQVEDMVDDLVEGILQAWLHELQKGWG